MKALPAKSFKRWWVNFFSGFSLWGEEELFEAYLKRSQYTVSGFSLGAVRAFEYVQNNSARIDTLQLFSPAFFQDKSEKFKRLQTISYQKNSDAYEKLFLENIAHPSTHNMISYFKKDTLESLQKLLEFTWEEEKLVQFKKRGIHIEVYFGGEDKIIDSKKAYDFFKNYATVYFIKEGGHTLWTK